MRLEPSPQDAVVHVPPSLEVDLRPEGSPRFAAVVRLRGEHDISTVADLRQAIGAIAGTLLVDLTDCTFIDSSALGALITAAQDLGRDGYALEILAPADNETVSRTLAVVSMRDLVVVHGSRPVD